jgi:hypothetical protein
MKISRLESHDRLQSLQQDQALNLAQGAQDCLKLNRLSIGLQQYSPYIYIFAHPRTADDGVTKRMIWQPRLTKPSAQTNSYLFRAISNTDQLEICWMIPPKEMWTSYKKGNVTEHAIVNWSIEQYKTNKPSLERPENDDLPDEKIKDIYRRVAMEIDEEIRMDKLYALKEIKLNG